MNQMIAKSLKLKKLVSQKVFKNYLKSFEKYLKDHRLSLVFLLFLTLVPAPSWYFINQVTAKKEVPIRHLEPEQINLDFYPVNQTQANPPALTAQSVVIVDVDSKVPLFSKNPQQELRPASTTKIMTALVALESLPLDRVVTLKTVKKVGQTMGLEPGDQITIENLLYGTLVKSGNDAAHALAQVYPGGETAFVNRMNQKAQELGLTHTQFQNPSGLDQYQHYSTVRDLTVLAAEALKNPIFSQMVSIAGLTVTDLQGETVYELENVNELLASVPGVKGIKTGWTDLAGECLITYVERNNHRVVFSIMGSQDRFGETKLLINWVFSNFTWEKVNQPTL